MRIITINGFLRFPLMGIYLTIMGNKLITLYIKLREKPFPLMEFYLTSWLLPYSMLKGSLSGMGNV